MQLCMQEYSPALPLSFRGLTADKSAAGSFAAQHFHFKALTADRSAAGSFAAQ